MKRKKRRGRWGEEEKEEGGRGEGKEGGREVGGWGGRAGQRERDGDEKNA